MAVTNKAFPLGASLTRAELDADLHTIGARLRSDEPVSWVPALNGWYVTRRDLVGEILEDAERFTVDDPRFAVKQVMGPNMLGLDGPAHTRHRTPFEPEFKMSSVRQRLVATVDQAAAELVSGLSDRGHAEVRADLAAPLAVRVVGDVLGLDVEPDRLLGWYDDIVETMTAVSNGVVHHDARPPVMDRIGEEVKSVSKGRSTLLTAVASELGMDDVIANAAVVLFGGIETSETMTAGTFAHLLALDGARDIVETPGLLMKAIDESLRIEPPVAQIDRFATRDTTLADVNIGQGDFVVCSVAAANRDPEFYPEPDLFDPHRANARNHLAFAKGPHVCIGMHLARVETRAAIEAAFALLPGLRLDNEVSWSGSVFRKPEAVRVRWEPSSQERNP